MSSTKIDQELRLGFRMGDCLIQPLRNCILTPDGEEAYLPRKPMDVLVCLASHAGQVVGKNQILNAVWGSRSGGDEGLKRCIHAIRKALKDDSQNPCYIKTIHRRGYLCESQIDLHTTQAVAGSKQDPKTNMRPGYAPSRLTGRHSLSILQCRMSWRSQNRSGSQPDPEIISHSLSKIFNVLQEEIEIYEGSRQIATGSSLQVWFGYNGPQEASVSRAIYCGLALLTATEDFNDSQPAELPLLDLAIAVHNGELAATMSPFSNEAVMMVGFPVQVVESLAGAAPGGSLVCTEATLGLAEGQFEYRFLCGTTANNNEKVVEVTGEVYVSDMLKRHSYSGIMVARGAELNALRRLWSSTSQGTGAQVIISGESGIGKTRLAFALCDELERTPDTRIIYCQCSSIFQYRPFYPILRFMRSVLRELSGEDRPTPADVEELVRHLDIDSELAVALFCELLEVPNMDRSITAHLSPKRKQSLLTNMLRLLLTSTGSRKRLLVLVEDLQWADASFRNLLGSIVDQGPAKGCMLLITTRLGAGPEWTSNAHLSHLLLKELNPDDSRALVDSINTDVQPTDDIVLQVIDHSNGNPLFLEEMTRAVVDAKVHGHDVRVPQSLRQALMVRLDLLDGARDLLLSASILGREFDYSLLSIIADHLNAATLQQQIAQLVDAGILFQHGIPPNSTYSFKHGLLQREAYRLTGFRVRQRIHGNVAEELIENPFGHLPASAPELIAHHSSASENFMQAVDYWIYACRDAQQQSANIECIQFGERGLDDLAKIPISKERDKQELELLVSMGPAQMAILGYSATQVSQTYERAHQLCDSSGKSLDQVPALFGLWTHYVVRGSTLRAAADIARKLLKLTEGRDEDLLLEARVMLGVTLTHLAEYNSAITYLDAALTQYEQENHRGHCYLFGQEPGMAASIYRGLARAQTNSLEAAQQDFLKGLALGKASGHPHSIAFAMCISARTLFTAGDAKSAKDLAEEAHEIALTQGFSGWLNYSEFLLTAIKFWEEPSVERLGQMIESLNRVDTEGNSIVTLDFSTIATRAMLEIEDWGSARSHNQRSRAELDRRGFCSDAENVVSVTRELLDSAPLREEEREQIRHWIARWHNTISIETEEIQSGQS